MLIKTEEQWVPINYYVRCRANIFMSPANKVLGYGGITLSVRLAVHLFVCLSVCLSVCTVTLSRPYLLNPMTDMNVSHNCCPHTKGVPWT